MLEQLVECENRLLEEQRRFNELLLAWRSGDLGDDLTRMKIDQMQREVDALGRQLTALRTVIAAQADRERAGYRQGTMPKAAYGWPAYGQPGAAAQPWDQTMPRPAAQTAEPGKPQQAYQQTPPQPAVQTAETGNPIPPAPGAMSQSARETGNPQQAYQQTPPRPVAAQAGYQQASGKQDLEKTIGRAILPVCAAGLIFLSLVFFAMLVLPYLSQGVKMVLMYTVSAAITLAGGILVAHDRRNKAFLGLLGCGMGAWYLSLFLSDFYFHAINDGILYLGLLVWAVVLCVLSRLRSNLFLIIGQIGVGISLILGVLMCNWTEDAERFLILSIYYAVTQTIFFVSHLRREYYRNAVNLVSWSIGLLILVLGAAASYTEGSAAGNVSVVLLLALAAVPVLLGVAAAEMDENGKLLGGIVGVFEPVYRSGAALTGIWHCSSGAVGIPAPRGSVRGYGSAGGGCFCADVLCGSCRAVFRGVYIDGTSGGGVPSVRFPAQKKSIPGGGTRLWHPAVADPDERGHENGLGTGIFLQRGAADPVLQGTV